MPYCYFIATSWKENGVNQTLIALAHDLARRNHKVVLIVDAQKQYLVNPDANPAIFTWPSPRPTRLQDGCFLWNSIQQYRPHCLVTDGYGSENWMLVMSWLTRLPGVTWYHTLQTQRHIQTTPQNRLQLGYLSLRKSILRKLSQPYYVASSQAAYDDITNYYHIPATKTKVIPFVMKDPYESDLPAQSKTNHLICVGRFDHDKGQDLLIRAIALICKAHPDILVELVGDGPLRQNYSQLIQELGLTNTIVFAGRVVRQDVLKKMAAAKITIVPSRAESFGLVNIESLSVGTPVVAARVGGIPDLIRDGVDGFLFSPESYQELAEKLHLLLSEPTRLAEMSRNARERFLSCYEEQRNIGKMSDWFESIPTQPAIRQEPSKA